MIFQDWTGIVRVVSVGALAYLALVVLLRVSGSRTLAKLNAFDLVVTVALGSILGTVLLSRDVPLFEGIVAFVLLVGLQWGVTSLSVRSGSFAKLVRSEPILLFRDGEALPRAMRQARVTKDELAAVIRRSSVPVPADVTAVILETDGSFSVIGPGSLQFPAGDVRKPDGVA